MPPRTHVRLSEAARMLGCSTKTLRRRIADGSLSAERAQRGSRVLWLVDVAELRRYADSRGQTLSSDPGQSTTGGRTSPALVHDTDADSARQSLLALQKQVETLSTALSRTQDLFESTVKALPSGDELREERNARLAAEREAADLRQRLAAVEAELAAERALPWWRRLLWGARR